MAYDGSLASNAEAWLVSTIGALSEIPAANVVPFEGIHSFTGGMQIIDQLRGERTPWVAVMLQGFDPRLTTEGDQDYALVFVLWLAVQNARDAGGARVGETGTPVTPGTNLLTELIVNALDNASILPASSSVLAADHVQVQPGTTLSFKKGVSIVEIKVNILASKKAS